MYLVSFVCVQNLNVISKLDSKVEIVRHFLLKGWLSTLFPTISWQIRGHCAIIIEQDGILIPDGQGYLWWVRYAAQCTGDYYYICYGHCAIVCRGKNRPQTGLNNVIICLKGVWKLLSQRSGGTQIDCPDGCSYVKVARVEYRLEHITVHWLVVASAFLWN